MSQQPSLERRTFLTAAAASVGGAGLLSSVASADEQPDASSTLIKPGSRVLFQGDSITDTGRDRKSSQPNHAAAMGSGYAFLAAADLLIQRPKDDLKFFNRGVSGNKVHQLAERWQQDCLDIKPDVVSILIGVNDIWHWLNGNYDGTIDTYRKDYQALAERTRQALPEAKLVVCEPFVLKTGAVGDKWFPKFDEFRAAAKQVADEFAHAWVPFQSVLNAAEQFAPAATWAGDGVHPSQKGAAVLANAWNRAVGA